jgi:hypothetical protein
MSSLQITPEWNYILPFGTSRLLDILIGPIWSIVVIILLSNKNERQIITFVIGMFCGLLAGVSGFALAGIGILGSLIAGLIFGFAFRAFALDKSPDFELDGRLATVSFVMGASLIPNVIFGLSAIIAATLSIITGMIVGAGLITALWLLFRLPCWSAIGRWLMVE